MATASGLSPRGNPLKAAVLSLSASAFLVPSFLRPHGYISARPPQTTMLSRHDDVFIGRRLIKNEDVLVLVTMIHFDF